MTYFARQLREALEFDPDEALPDEDYFHDPNSELNEIVHWLNMNATPHIENEGQHRLSQPGTLRYIKLHDEHGNQNPHDITNEVKALPLFIKDEFKHHGQELRVRIYLNLIEEDTDGNWHASASWNSNDDSWIPEWTDIGRTGGWAQR